MFGTDPFSGVRSAVDAAAGVDRSGWSGAAKSAAVLELLAAQERLAALVAAVVGEWDAEQAWALDGSLSPVAWLAHRAPLTRQHASTLVRTARHCEANEHTAKALDAGDITSTHAEIAAQAAKHREELYAEHEDTILDAARRLDPTGFRQVMQHWRSCCDDAKDHKDAKDQIERNYFEMNPTFAGVGHVDGRFDPIATKAILDALDALEPPDPPDPLDGPTAPRTQAQRRADALYKLCCGGRRPTVTIDVILDVDALAGRPPADLSERCCDLAGVGPLSPAVAQTLACDAAIGPRPHEGHERGAGCGSADPSRHAVAATCARLPRRRLRRTRLHRPGAVVRRPSHRPLDPPRPHRAPQPRAPLPPPPPPPTPTRPRSAA